MNRSLVYQRLIISKHLPRIVVLPISLFIIFFSGYYGYSRISAVELNEIEHINNLARSIAKSTEFFVASDNQKVLQEFSEVLFSVESVKKIRFQRESEIVSEFVANEPENKTRPSTIGLYIRPLISTYSLENEWSYPIVRTELSEDNSPQSISDLEFGDSTNSEEGQIGKLLVSVNLESVYFAQLAWINKALLYSLLALFVIASLALWFARSISDGIRSITARILNLAAKEKNIAPIPDSGIEINQLSNAFEYLEQELSSFHLRLESEVESSTRQLQKAMSELEGKNTELEIAKNESDKANEFKTRFLANVSHEIRTPLNAIVGSCAALTDSARSNIQNTHVKRIENSVQGILSHVEQLLDISSIEAGKLHIETEELDLFGLISDVYKETSSAFATESIHFMIFIDNSTPQFVRCDALRLKQVLVNLISNALKFTSQGHVAVDIRARSLDGPDQCELSIEVEDTGRGVPAAEAENIFLPFYQVDMSSTRSAGGVGLGLNIVRESMHAMQGEVEVVSDAGCGATFSVRIPVQCKSLSEGVQAQANKLPTVFLDCGYDPFYSRIADYLSGVFKNVERYTEKGVELEAPVVLYRELSSQTQLCDNELSGTSVVTLTGFDAKVPAVAGPGRGVTMEFDPTRGIFEKNLRAAALSAGEEVGCQQSSISKLAVNEPDDELKTSSIAASTVSLLLIDDQQVNLDVLEIYLKDYEFTVHTAMSASEAKEIIDSQCVQLIVMDIHLPKVDGFQMLDWVRASESMNKYCRIYAFTADAFESTRRTCLEHGFDGFITKPLAKVEFDEVMHDAGLLVQKAEVVQQIVQLLDADVATAAKLLDQFLVAMEQGMQKLHFGVLENDLQAIHKESHAIKGICSLLPFPGICDLATEAAKCSEEQLTDKDSPVAKLIRDMNTTYTCLAANSHLPQSILNLASG